MFNMINFIDKEFLYHHIGKNFTTKNTFCRKSNVEKMNSFFFVMHAILIQNLLKGSNFITLKNT